MIKDGWPICDGCKTSIGYEGHFVVDGKDYCVWCRPDDHSLDRHGEGFAEFYG